MFAKIKQATRAILVMGSEQMIGGQFKKRKKNEEGEREG